jgi:hypothetical protein
MNSSRHHRPSRALGLAAALWLIAAAGSARSGVLEVRADGSGVVPTIQAALDGAAPGDTVLLAAGVYRGPGNRDLEFRGKPLVLRSAAGPAACVIDCADSTWQEPHRALLFRAGETRRARVEGLTILHGRSRSMPSSADLELTASDEGEVRHLDLVSGGAVLCIGASPTISGCVFALNRAMIGGAVACREGAAPRLVGCLLQHNTAQQGGGVHAVGSAPLLEGCYFVLNTADRGGGLAAYDCAPRLQGCTFDRNSGLGGGGISCERGAGPTLTGCLLCGNQSEVGGGLLVEDASPTLEGCTLAVNVAGSGGGLSWTGGRATLRGVIIAYSVRGAAFACEQLDSLDVDCCLIYGNCGGDWIGPLASRLGTGGNLAADPRFINLGRGDFRLAVDSPGRSPSRSAGAEAAAGCSPMGSGEQRREPPAELAGAYPRSGR